jgi:hypothetical protein
MSSALAGYLRRDRSAGFGNFFLSVNYPTLLDRFLSHAAEDGWDGSPQTNVLTMSDESSQTWPRFGGAFFGRDRGKKTFASAGCRTLTARAAARAADLAPVLKELQAAGVTSLHGIATALNKRGIPTATSRGAWQATQVRRVLVRLQVGRCGATSNPPRNG